MKLFNRKRIETPCDCRNKSSSPLEKTSQKSSLCRRRLFRRKLQQNYAYFKTDFIVHDNTGKQNLEEPGQKQRQRH